MGLNKDLDKEVLFVVLCLSLIMTIMWPVRLQGVVLLLLGFLWIYSNQPENLSSHGHGMHKFLPETGQLNFKKLIHVFMSELFKYQRQK